MQVFQSWLPLLRKSVAGNSRLALSMKPILAVAGARISILVSLLSVAVIWAGASYLTTVDARRTEAAAFQDTANLALAFEEHIIRLIQAYDQILLFARSSLAKDPERFDLSQWARDQHFANDVALQIAISDENGTLTASNLGLSPTPTSIRDREHFRAHLETDRDVLFISKPVMGRISGKWSIHLTRRINAPDGSFSGIITVAIDPYYLAGFYESVNLRNKGMVLLAGLDGIVRARVSGGTQTVGQSISSGRLFKLLAQASSGAYVTDGQLDGNPRLTSYRKVRGYPLVVAVGLARSEVFASVEYNRILYFCAAGLVSIIVLIFSAMLVRRQIGMHRARDKLLEAANIDALTGLSSRNRLHEVVSALVADPRSRHERFTLFLLDLDNFKFINDTLGHEAGDIVLRTAAKRIKRMSRNAYLVSRLGGDEFAVLVRNSEPRDTEEMALLILNALRKKMDYRGHCVQLSSSIGIAHFSEHAATWSDIFRAADLALYRAKKTGRNRFVVFDSAMLVEAENRFAILESVRSAIKYDQVVPFYQPKIAIATGEIAGFEALARIVQEDGGVTTPKEFALAFEDAEVARAFGLRMVERVTHDMKAWFAAGLDIKSIAVNVSTPELRANDYSQRVLAILQASGIPIDRFEIEVTETVAFDDDMTAIGHNLRTLAAHNISIALDDFGTGFASLTHLKSLPIAQIKIDRSFVGHIVADPESRSIIDAIVRLSHSLGKSVVAEGVEDEAQLVALSELECDIAQGFLFSEPLRFDEVEAFLLHHTARRLAQARRDNQFVGTTITDVSFGARRRAIRGAYTNGRQG
jgi:diguanylate cyclase (GGDEF)-like protein